MEENNIGNGTQLLLKRNIPIKVVVTSLWKSEMQEQLQRQIQATDAQMQQLEFQGKRAIAELEKQSTNPNSPQILQQVEAVKSRVNEQKIKLLDQKNQLLQQANQLGTLELNQEVLQGNVESFFRVQQGDNLIQKMQVEILLEDGVIKEIRGNP
ncbi:YlqD family protein [Synechococcus sp. Nb3U1]|uniref:YlqD family protein n=1 Tax=Synechococcus sp. Nb3U1 TaxID=1914529 RepID=UPI001F46FD32|nr:YlqD family protein [Synechococcus sp. Nb3U1]MCF2970552.1 YlqD family protein [Synechococcus sp. Nb3U1]